MNINFSSLDFERKIQSIDRQRSAMETLLGQKNSIFNGKRDSYVRSTAYESGIYTVSSTRKNTHISDSVMTIMNNDISNITKCGDMYECGGIYFTAEQIPKINVEILDEVKAKNNIIDFGKCHYFKYVDAEGENHCLYTDEKGIGSVVSEIMRGEPYDADLEKYASFWRYMMTEDPIYIGLTYSDEEIRSYMSEAGMETGFFTVRMGDREMTQFFSATKVTSPIQSKERYDLRYQSLTSDGNLLNGYEPGSVFKIDGTEYILSSAHTLDIPYGEDIYNLKYPDNYRGGVKIE